MIFTHPLEALFCYLKVVSFYGILFSIPVLVLHIYLYIRPGLYSIEDRLYRGLSLGFCLISGPLAYGLWALACPLILYFLVDFGAEPLNYTSESLFGNSEQQHQPPSIIQDRGRSPGAWPTH